MKSSLTPDVIQGILKASLTLTKDHNAEVWAVSKSLSSQINAEIKIAENEVKAKEEQSGSDYPDDFKGFTPEQRSEEVAKLLDYKLFTKELTASELRELKDIFNLKAKDQDIHIEQVDFRAIEPELADVVAAVEWQINEFNQKSAD